MSCYPDAYLNEWPDCAIPLLNACIQNDVGKLRSMLERKDVREHISFLRAGTHKERDPDEWPCSSRRSMAIMRLRGSSSRPARRLTSRRDWAAMPTQG